MTDIEDCPHCQRRLIEIDHFGERLVGCIKCNQWKRLGSPTDRIFRLPEDDLQALSNLSDALQKAEDTTP